MVYAYDLWLPMPVKDLYDTQMMLASVNAAKDMYEKGLQEMKDFRKEYGDFYSPIQSDMDWYEDEVLKPVRDTINNLYAHGIDPARSAEGRAAISKAIGSINIGAVNLKKRDAENAELYIKSRNEAMKNGTWNPEYERDLLGGQLLEEWDGSLGNWKATSVSPYLDYELKYGHLFDKMGYEYDPEESSKHPGMMVLTKNKQRMRDILSASRPDLVNDPQYQYDFERIKADLKTANPGMSDADLDTLATTAIEDEIIERNYKGGMQIQEDPIAKEARQLSNAIRLENLKHQNALELRRTPQAKATSSVTSSSRSSSGGGGTTGLEFSAKRAIQAAGSAAILRQDSLALKQLGIVSASDFSPKSAEGWIELAQGNIANSVFDKNFVNTINRSLHSNSVGVDITKLPSILPEGAKSKITEKYNDQQDDTFMSKLHPMNLRFVLLMSTPFFSRDLLKYYKRDGLKTAEGNTSWFMLEDNDIHNIYTADEVSAMTEGYPIDPKSYEYFKKDGDKIREFIRTRGINALHGASYVLSPMGKDGKQRVFAKIDVGQFKAGQPKWVFDLNTGEDGGDATHESKISIPNELKNKTLYIDMGIHTLGLNSLDLDESLDSMSGSLELDKEYGATKNRQYRDVDYIDLEDEYAIPYTDEDVNAILNGTYEDPFNF